MERSEAYRKGCQQRQNTDRAKTGLGGGFEGQGGEPMPETKKTPPRPRRRQLYRY